MSKSRLPTYDNAWKSKDDVKESVTPEVEWKRDEDVNLCLIEGCGRYFTLFCRRHHCRKCGGIYCNNHCDKLSMINGSLHRVCSACFPKLYGIDTPPSYDWK